MSNYSLTRPTQVGYCTTTSGYTSATSASAIAGVSDLGSCREISFEITSETLTATSSKNNDAVVATSVAGYQGTLTMVLEEMTSSAMALAWGLSGSATNLFFDASATTPTNYTIVSSKWYIDGSASTLLLYKCNLIPGSVRKLSREQELLEVKFNVLVDPDASAGKRFFAFLQQ